MQKIVAKHRIRGINWLPESKRFYPQKSLAAQVIGAVNIDNAGRFGIERAYEDWIAGAEGTHHAVRDGRGHVLGSRGAMLESPTRGDDLVLTIDAGLQYVAEESLRESVLRTGAQGGVAVAMDPHTGDLLAVANYPTFDLNDNNHENFRKYQTNRAVAHAIEPGSVMKVFTVAAALHDDHIHEEEIIDCQGGTLRVPGGVIRDWKLGFQQLTVRQVSEELLQRGYGEDRGPHDGGTAPSVVTRLRLHQPHRRGPARRGRRVPRTPRARAPGRAARRRQSPSARRSAPRRCR